MYDATASVPFTVHPAPSVAIAPNAGPAGTRVTVNGAGWHIGEPVTVKYDGGTTTSTLCSATAASDGTFTCAGRIPSASAAGPPGAHSIVAKSLTAAFKATITYTLR
jgi:hypothetical protein